MIMDSTTTPPLNSSSLTLDHQQTNSPAWRKDPLIGFRGPMTRSRAKKMKETLHDLVQTIHQETKPQVEDKPTFITLLRVIED